jgi:hypothetical protein
LLVSGLILCGLAVAPLARAETSYHKMKKRLHQIERITGDALEGAGEALGEKLSGMEFDVEIDIEHHKSSGDKSSGESSSRHSEKPAPRPVKEELPKIKRN